MRVAVQGDRILGLLMGRNEESYSRRQVLRYWPKRILLSIYLRGTQVGRRYLKKQPHGKSGRSTPVAELWWWFWWRAGVVCCTRRDTGERDRQITASGFYAVYARLRNRGFFVLTDDFCNVDFYIRRGYKKVKSVPSRFRKSGKPAKFYLLKNSLLWEAARIFWTAER